MLISAPDGSTELPIEEQRDRSFPPLYLPGRVRPGDEERIISSRLTNAKTKEGRFKKMAFSHVAWRTGQCVETGQPQTRQLDEQIGDAF